MPSWNIHLSIANKINRKLKLDKNSFYLGNTLPDVDYGMKITRKDTHFYNLKCDKCPNEFLPNVNEFFKLYKSKLYNPIIMGMYIHLLTDYYYNNEIFSKYWIQDENQSVIGIKLLNGKIKNFPPEDKNIRKKYKHCDLELYGKYLFKNENIYLPKFDENILKNIKDLNIIDYNEKILRSRIHYLNTEYIKKNKYTLVEKIFGLRYKMISKDDLDEMYYGCLEFIENNIKNLKFK